MIQKTTKPNIFFKTHIDPSKSFRDIDYIHVEYPEEVDVEILLRDIDNITVGSSVRKKRQYSFSALFMFIEAMEDKEQR